MIKDLRKRIIRYIGITIFVLITGTVLVLENIFPYKPIDFIGWLILICCGIPVLFLLEWLNEKFYKSKLNNQLSQLDSFTRIIIGVIVGLFYFCFLLLLWYLLTKLFAQHFSPMWS